ncbi:hypothetical protein [Terriglobus saanensis]|uniref:Uncharacterized protein n=1 Tax=Terriglobus saanensis (strain ATCC BAA-1853 / DSM 23119 / SP1PR4) TaxID=401053 RepID=E8V6Q4_TERSS|nr:hypothetical protein [Terriglobus saanensis]ADV83856.1 hypothetical protein AciPR4_3098 [Terriglobus saanensis SP1PR4]
MEQQNENGVPDGVPTGEKIVQERRTWLGGLLPRFKQPEALYYFRMIEVALEEAQDGKKGAPTDEALLARDWIARPTPKISDRLAYLTSFSHACFVLELAEDVIRCSLLGVIDRKQRFDTRECAERLAELQSHPLEGDEVELFDAPRVVPVRDQGVLFA